VRVGINGQSQSDRLDRDHLRFRRHRIAFVALLVIGVLYLIGLVVMPPDALTHHDTGAKYLQVRNLRITPSGLDYSINYPARPLDPNLQYVPFRDKQFYTDGHEHIYLQWPIFLGLLTRIPWKVLGFWGLYVVPLLAGLGTCWATYLLAMAVGVPKRLAWLAIPLVGLATPVAIYSLLFFEHTLADMLVALSLLFALLAIPYRKELGPSIENMQMPWRGISIFTIGKQRSIAVSAVLLAVAIYFRSELYVLAAVIGLTLVVMAWRVATWRRLLAAWAVGFVLALVPLWSFYMISDGTLLPLHAIWYFAGSEGASLPGEPVQFQLPALRYIVQAGWGTVPDFLFGPQSFPSSPIYPLWVGAVGLIGTLLCGVSALLRLARGRLGSIRVRLTIFTIGLAGVTLASAYILLMPQYYHNLHGFLLASPFVALALWPPTAITTRDGLTRQGFLYVVTLLHVGLHALVISSLSGLGPISRSEWGQRYLLAAYPALVVLALLAAWRIWTEYRPLLDLRRVAAFSLSFGTVLMLVGFFFTLRGYGALYDERTQVKSWLTLSESLPDHEPLVTDEWWLPLNLGADFYTRPIMLAVGDDKLTHWASDMRTLGVMQFGFMTDKPAIFTSAWLSHVPGLRADGPPAEVRGIWMQKYTFAGPSSTGSKPPVRVPDPLSPKQH
jgi:hypothetical protein